MSGFAQWLRHKTIHGLNGHGADHAAMGLGGVKIYIPTAGVGPVTRNSANDATDDDEVTMATIVVPGNNGAVPGSQFIFVSMWENTNSASIKNIIERIGGGSIGSVTQTTSVTYGQRQNFDVIDDNTVTTVNSFGSAGTGANGNAPLDIAIANLGAVGFTLAYTCKWSSQPVAGEFIRLKHCKIIQINP